MKTHPAEFPGQCTRNATSNLVKKQLLFAHLSCTSLTAVLCDTFITQLLYHEFQLNEISDQLVLH